MSMAAVAAHNKPNTKHRPIHNDPSRPLHNLKREQFCQLVAQGVKSVEAYETAGYHGSKVERSQLRNAPEVVERINWLLNYRVQTSAQSQFRPEKKLGDAKLRLVRELERLAYADIREIVSWDRKAQLSPDGDVIGVADEIIAQPSHKLSRSAAASIKSVTTKSGALKLETHDKLAALRDLAKVLGVGSEFDVPVQTVTLNQINVQSGAIDDVRRIAFLLAAAENAPKPMETLTIEGRAEPVAAEPPLLDEPDRPPLKAKRGRKPKA
jgi:hypothetical protein